MPVLPPGGKTLVALVVWPPWCLTSVNSSCGFFCLARGAKDTPNTTSPPALFCCLFVGFNEKTTENHPGFFGGLSSVCFLFQIIFMYPFFSWADTERTQEKGPKCTAWKFQPLLVFSIHLRPLKTAILVALKTNGRLCFAGSFSLNMFFVSLLNLSILFLDEWISSKFGLNNCWVMTAVYVFWYIYIYIESYKFMYISTSNVKVSGAPPTKLYRLLGGWKLQGPPRDPWDPRDS